MNGAIHAALLAWSAWIAWGDWRRRKIPNVAIFLGLALGLFALALRPGAVPARGWGDAGLGLLAGFAWTFPGYLGRQLGAGDVKYAAVIGGLCGAWPGLYAQLYAMIALGLAGVAALIAKRRIGRQAPAIPAGIAISAGFLVFLWQYWSRELGGTGP